MVPGTFSVVLDGRTRAAQDTSEVAGRLAVLFKTTPERVNPLLTGKAVIIRRGLDEQSAQRYLAAIERAGAACHIETETLASAERSSSIANGPDVPQQAGNPLPPKIPKKGPREKYCSECRAVIKTTAEICPDCGVRQFSPNASAPVDTDVQVITKSKSRQTNPIVKVLGVLVLLGVLGNFALILMNWANPAQSPSPTVERSKATANTKAAIDRCVASGEAMATTYIANVGTSKQAGLMADEMRDKGCATTASAFKDVTSCQEECKRGFKAGLYRAMDAAK